MRGSSQSRIVVLVHFQVFLLLLLLLVDIGRRTVQNIVIILTLELVASSLETSEATASASTRSTTTAAAVTTATTSATTARWLFLLNLGRLIVLLLFLGELLHLLDLLLEPGTTVLLEPLLLLGYETDAVVEVVGHDWSRDAKKGELLDDDQVEVE